MLCCSQPLNTFWFEVQTDFSLIYFQTKINRISRPLLSNSTELVNKKYNLDDVEFQLSFFALLYYRQILPFGKGKGRLFFVYFFPFTYIFSYILFKYVQHTLSWKLIAVELVKKFSSFCGREISFGTI